MERRQTDGRKDSAYRALPLVVFRDLSTDSWVVDVSEWDEPVDCDVVAEMGDPVLVCFGGHAPGTCPLQGSDEPSEHGIVFEILAGRQSDAAFVRRFREIARNEKPITVRRRGEADAAAPQAQRPAGTARGPGYA